MKRMIGSGSMHDGVYVYKGVMQGVSFATTHGANTILWHARMGHPSAQAF